MNTDAKRRLFLKASTYTAAGVATALLAPRTLLAAWNQAAFTATSVEDALKNDMGDAAAETSPEVTITAPDVAENGAVVPIKINTEMAGVESIALLSQNNANPLCATFKLGKRTKPQIAIRIKMGKSGDVIAAVKSGGKLYTARTGVKVTTGGCA